MSSHISRSARLRKYGAVYRRLMGKVQLAEPGPAPISNSDSAPAGKVSSKKRTLNEYQKFVQEESKKQRYKGVPAPERLAAIAKSWKRGKKSTKNRDEKKSDHKSEKRLKKTTTSKKK